MVQEDGYVMMKMPKAIADELNLEKNDVKKICDVCGYENDKKAKLCKMCSNFLTTEVI